MRKKTNYCPLRTCNLQVCTGTKWQEGDMYYLEPIPLQEFLKNQNWNKIPVGQRNRTNLK